MTKGKRKDKKYWKEYCKAGQEYWEKYEKTVIAAWNKHLNTQVLNWTRYHEIVTQARNEYYDSLISIQERMGYSANGAFGRFK